MIDPEFLYTLAEVAAAFAGFSTLISFVAARHISEVEPTRIIAMLALSIMVVLFSLLPAIPQAYGLEAPTYWYALNGLYFIAWLSYYIRILANLRQGGLGAHFTDLPLLNRINTFGVHPVSILVVGIGAIGITPIHSAYIYVSGLFVMLFLSCHLFLQIVISLIRSEFDSPESSSDA